MANRSHALLQAVAVIRACEDTLARIKTTRAVKGEKMIAYAMTKRRWGPFGPLRTREQAIDSISFPFSDYNDLGMLCWYQEDTAKRLLDLAQAAMKNFTWLGNWESGPTLAVTAEDFESIQARWPGFLTREEANGTRDRV